MALSLDFAFEGFRLIHERPRLLWLWGAVALIGNGLAAVLFVGMAGPVVESLLHSGAGVLDAQRLTTLLLRAAPGVLASAAVLLITSAILTAAICRAALGEEEDGPGFLQFGPRELQMIVVLLVTQMLILVIAATLIGLAALPAWLGAGDSLATPVLAGGATIAAAVAAWLNVRLMFNAAQSFAERRIAVFNGFALTSEAFWTLLAGWLLVRVLALVVVFLGGEAINAVVAIVFGVDAARDGTVDMTSLHAFFTPATTLSLILAYTLVVPQVTTIVGAAPVAAFRAVTGRDAGSRVQTVV